MTESYVSFLGHVGITRSAFRPLGVRALIDCVIVHSVCSPAARNLAGDSISTAPELAGTAGFPTPTGQSDEQAFALEAGSSNMRGAREGPGTQTLLLLDRYRGGAGGRHGRNARPQRRVQSE